MPPLFIISSKWSDADRRNVESVFHDNYVRITLPAQNTSQVISQWVLHTFEHVTDEIEEKIEQHGGLCALRNAIAIVELNDQDLNSLEDLSPISVDHAGWTIVTTMLVLAFPEIHWVFMTGSAPIRSQLFEDAHIFDHQSLNIESLNRIRELNAQGFTPLFDPTGLRNAIRLKIKDLPDGDYVPVRTEVAASIDEEIDYAYLNAHTSYRFGFRCHILTCFGLTDRVLGNQVVERNGGPPQAGVSLVFEDLYLNFPDKIADPKLRFSNLRQRDRLLPKLKGVTRRVFITVGHKRRERDQQTWAENHWYTDSLRTSGKHCKTIYKPGSGIFDIWNRSGMSAKLRKTGGRAKDYVWPPKKLMDDEIVGGHSAHGRLLVIASRLIQRADHILQSARSVPQAIHGAVLALEAQEYLGHRTPTTSLEALALKNQLEVRAECMFYGVEYNMDVISRFHEIEDEVDSIGWWFQPRSRQKSKLNAEIRIVSELLKIFRDHSQFDEEQKSLNRIRVLHRRLWFRRNMLWAWLTYPFRWYVEFLLGSLFRYALALTLWIFVFTLFYWYFQSPGEWPPDRSWLALKDLDFWHGLSDALTAFLGMQPPHDIKDLIQEGGHQARWIMLVTATAIVSSFVHLGIFISYLYSMIARK